MQEIRQTESAECGLACLLMVASHYGRVLDLRQGRARFPSSGRGVTLKALVEMANQLGLQARALKAEPDQLAELACPAILHWDLNHFVVLISVRKGVCTLIDPALGKRTLNLLELAQYFTGVVLELRPGPDFIQEKRATRLTVLQMLGSVHGLKSAFVLVIGLSFALQIFVSIMPLYLQWVIDQVLLANDVNLLLTLSVGFALLLFIQISAQFVRSRTLIYLAHRLGQQWVSNLFAHLIRLPLAFFEKRTLGEVTSRLDSMASVQRSLSTNIVEVLVDGVMATITLAMLCFYSFNLTLISMLAIAAYLTFRTLAFHRFKRETEKQLENDASHQSYLLECLRAIAPIKAGNFETTRQLGYFAALNASTNSQIRIAQLQLNYNSINQLLFGSERLLIIAVGAHLAMQNQFTIGMVIAFLAYKDMFVQRMTNLIDKGFELGMLKVHTQRIADIALEAKEVDDDLALGLAAHADVHTPPSLELKSLCFRYGQGDPWVISEINCSISAGENVAIVGASGCGKTTLMKVMLGLLQADAGEIHVNKQPISQFGRQLLREIAGVVLQDDQLFAGTIAHNIALGADAINMDRVCEAARLAGILLDIQAMPMRFESLIGDMGAALSGGQKQRIVLARALYRQPKILFLDEATSHLDLDNEKWVSQAIAGLNMTRIVIAHRPETIAAADRVLVMESGRIVREYRPTELGKPTLARAAA